MRKKIIAITAATLLLATACSCGSQQEPDSTTAKTPDASAQQEKPQQQAAEKTAQSFVDEFNANSSTQITDVEKFTPSDAIDSVFPIMAKMLDPSISDQDIQSQMAKEYPSNDLVYADTRELIERAYVDGDHAFLDAKIS